MVLYISRFLVLSRILKKNLKKSEKRAITGNKGVGVPEAPAGRSPRRLEVGGAASNQVYGLCRFMRFWGLPALPLLNLLAGGHPDSYNIVSCYTNFYFFVDNPALCGILIVEQNLIQALSVADRAYVLETGHLVMQGAARELLENKDVRKAYLGL
jgi:hypothetical protein